MVLIYSLTDNGKIFYIGKTKNIERRFCAHKRDSFFKSSAKDIRIRDIISDNRKLEYQIIKECEEIDSLKIESETIRIYAELGHELVNHNHTTKINLPLIDRQLLVLISQDKGTRECAKVLFKSSRTIENRRQGMKNISNTKTTAGLLMWGIEKGYITI